MTSKIENVIDALRKLSPERQEEVAGYIQAIAIASETPEAVDPNHLPAILAGLAEIERGEMATPEEVEAAYRSFVE